VLAGEFGGIEPQPRHHVGAEVLDHHVGAGDEPARDVEVGGLLEVEHEGTLAAVPHGVGRGVPARATGRIDADHVGAVVGELHGGERPGDVLAEVDDAQALEGSGSFHGYAAENSRTSRSAMASRCSVAVPSAAPRRRMRRR
jgi:hypothetical protein